MAKPRDPRLRALMDEAQRKRDMRHGVTLPDIPDGDKWAQVYEGTAKARDARKGVVKGEG